MSGERMLETLLSDAKCKAETDMQMRFTAGTEPEFAAVAFALWKPPVKRWRNQHDEEWNFDRLIDRVLERPFGEGACGGCHVPYAVATILRVDQEYDVLSADRRSAARRYLAELSRLLSITINDENCWDRSWVNNESLNLYGSSAEFVGRL